MAVYPITFDDDAPQLPQADKEASMDQVTAHFLASPSSQQQNCSVSHSLETVTDSQSLGQLVRRHASMPQSPRGLTQQKF